jgi:hypothetical protein
MSNKDALSRPPTIDRVMLEAEMIAVRAERDAAQAELMIARQQLEYVLGTLRDVYNRVRNEQTAEE